MPVNPLTNNVPLQRSSKGNGEDQAMAQYPMEDIARIGLLKMDFLGLANLSILGLTQQLLQRARGGRY